MSVARLSERRSVKAIAAHRQARQPRHALFCGCVRPRCRTSDDLAARLQSLQDAVKIEQPGGSGRFEVPADRQRVTRNSKVSDGC